MRESTLSLQQVGRRLERAGIPWALFAGAAAAAYGSTRPTTDVDILVPAEVGGRLARLFPKGRLERHEDGSVVLKLPDIEILAGLGWKTLHSGYRMDLDAAMAARLTEHEIAGVRVPVIPVEDNILLKAMAGRGPEVGKHDWEDVEAMLAHGPALDWNYLRLRAEACEPPLRRQRLLRHLEALQGLLTGTIHKAVTGRLAAQTGQAFGLARGQFLRVSDPQGEQVADLACFAREERREWLSAGRSFDYNSSIRLTTGHLLYSNRSRPMLMIVRDTVRTHDFLLTPCSAETFLILYGDRGDHPSCLDNLATHLAAYGIEPDDIPTTFNIFMNVETLPDGSLQIGPPASRAGDSIVFRAEMDLIVGLTACSAEITNNYRCTPIDYEILDCASQA